MSNTLAEAFFQDPRLQEAKKLIQSTLQDYQKQFNQVKPSDPNRKVAYQDLLKAFSDARGAPLYFPYIGSGLGHGPLVELLDGSIKYDFISGIGVHYWGHSHPDLINASIDAALNDIAIQGNLQQNQEALTFSQLLIQASRLDHCFLTTSGAMANENALKIALQKKAPAQRILAFERCFMGRTLALSQITDKPTFRDGLPLNYQIDYIPFYDPEHPEESTQKSLSYLKKHLMRYPKQHALMCMELVQGEGGFNVGTTAFFESICRLLKEHDILILFDEIQTFGRTPELFAFQYFKLDKYADLVTIGKLSQICATLFKKEVMPKPGLLSQTFIGSTTAIQVGLTIVKKLLNEHFFGNEGKIVQTHHYFYQKLKQIIDKHPNKAKGPYGVGTMIAFTPFEGDTKKVTQFVHELFENGVITFVAGANPTRVRFLLPVGVITEKEIDLSMTIIEKTLLSSGASS